MIFSRRWARAATVLVLLALPPAGMVSDIAGSVLTGTTIAVTVLAPSDAWARRSSSGGYSRPSSGASSFGSSTSRTPSFSSGYTRPRTPDVSSPSAPSSAGDRALSRSGSAQSLNDYRQRSQTPPGAGSPSSTGNRFGGTNSTGWYASRGWSAPSYAYMAPPRFGLWNGLFLWFMLDNLMSPTHTAFFYNHQDDVGYQQWRAEADRQARDNADLRAKLDQLDTQLAGQQGKPRDPNYLPPDIPVEAAVAEAQPQPQQSSWNGAWWLILLLAALLFLLWRARHLHASPISAPARKDTPVGPLNTVGTFLRQKLSGQPYTPSLFRVGMALTVDPTPFLLAGNHTKVSPPVSGNNHMTSVEAVGSLTSGGVTLQRLYLPGRTGFFQIHLDKTGFPDECRYFSVIDEVNPSDADEWAFWLDPADGMIGWPEFQTKDGKLYPRIWSPGLTRVPPQKFVETVETVRGTSSLSSQAMLYGVPTGAAPPAPQTEYVLVEAVEQEGRAGVQVAAGIDVNPASLSLS